MKRSATANWKGGLKAGKGTFSSASGTFSNVPYDFAQRFETGTGTSPEELIAAAHASCFSMALSAELEKVDWPSEFQTSLSYCCASFFRLPLASSALLYLALSWKRREPATQFEEAAA